MSCYSIDKENTIPKSGYDMKNIPPYRKKYFNFTMKNLAMFQFEEINTDSSPIHPCSKETKTIWMTWH